MHHHWVAHTFHSIAPAFGHATDLTYAIAFLAALFESMAFIGTLVPGSTIIMIAGFAASRGVVDPTHLIWYVIVGAIMGDSISYYFGTKGTRFFKDENKLLKASYLKRGEAFFKKHGTKSVFLGRFAPPLRAIIPFIAGVTRMDMKLFFFWNIASACFWSMVMVSIGYFFGSAYRTIEHWISRSSAIVIGILVLGFLLWHSAKHARPYARTLLKSLRRTIREAESHADTPH